MNRFPNDQSEDSRSWNDYRQDRGLSLPKGWAPIAILLLVISGFLLYQASKKAGFIISTPTSERVRALSEVLGAEEMSLCLWANPSNAKFSYDDYLTQTKMVEYDVYGCASIQPEDVTSEEDKVIVHATYEQAFLDQDNVSFFIQEVDEQVIISTSKLLPVGAMNALCAHSITAMQQLTQQYWGAYAFRAYSSGLLIEFNAYDRVGNRIMEPYVFDARHCTLRGREFGEDGSYLREAP